MIEIIAILSLAGWNSKKALENRRNPGVFYLLTVLFWVGFEILGANLSMVGAREVGIGNYVIAIIAGVIGGFIPRLILAGIGTGNYKTPAQKAAEKAMESSRALNTPAQIILSNLMSNKKGYSYYFYNNGKSLGIIPSNNQIVLPVEQSVNVITVSYGNTESAPFILTLNDGETAEVVFAKGKLQRRA
jgi:hypothetical protein